MKQYWRSHCVMYPTSLRMKATWKKYISFIWKSSLAALLVYRLVVRFTLLLLLLVIVLFAFIRVIQVYGQDICTGLKEEWQQLIGDASMRHCKFQTFDAVDFLINITLVLKNHENARTLAWTGF